ncbi:MAG TPA: penicillin-binding transpeptidase domain-containing protein [Cytophagaceae bacterium]|jgi:penicillin-binding protein 2|nr:penicillin-binding transpeptidase domain-containing protein [Cytophagaceae bacterium]
MNSIQRKVIQFVFVFVGLTYVVRLFVLQILDSRYKLEAEINAVEKIIDYPNRGLIYDRKGKLLVFNTPVFDITVILREFKLADTSDFCHKFGITPDSLKGIVADLKKDRGYSRNKPMPLFKQLSNEDFGKIQNFLSDYPGLYVQARSVRSYPHKSLANALGYIGEISRTSLEKQTNDYYHQGDYIGLSGLEQSYEEQLRGQRGVRFVMKDVRGVQKGHYRGGEYDTTAVAGENLVSTIDLELQEYGELLMQHKIGSIVAIEPSTGEILAFVSAPSYDPALLSGRLYSANYGRILMDPLKPLFNRPLMAQYPPGSIFKLAQALTGLQLGVITERTQFSCDKSLVNCHEHPSPTDLRSSIQWSCNPYYFLTFKKIINQDLSTNKFKDTEMGFDMWRPNILSMGFGSKLDVDLPNVKGGNIPSNQYYDKIYGDMHWKFSTIYSLGIGQGEISIIPIQMANFAAMIANRGYFYTPHLVRSIGQQKRTLEKYKVRHQTTIHPKYFKPIVDGMEQVVQAGTAAWTRSRDSVVICGKTGTAENPHGDDHSVFIAFAPKENPKIAIAVFVENAGFGAMTAAPIAMLLIHKYLKRAPNKYMEEYIINKDLMGKYSSYKK